MVIVFAAKTPDWLDLDAHQWCRWKVIEYVLLDIYSSKQANAVLAVECIFPPLRLRVYRPVTFLGLGLYICIVVHIYGERMSRKSALRDIPIRTEPVSTLTAPERDAVLDACRRLKSLAGPLLTILHAVQSALGYVPKDAVPLIASELNLSRADVHGVVTFYHYFRDRQPGRHVVHLCRAEACQSVGAVALEAHAKKTLGIDFHQTTADNAISLEPVYCLGNCSLGPSMMIDKQLQGRVTPERFDRLMAQTRAKA